MNFQKMHVLYSIDGKVTIAWEIHNSERLCSKLLKFSMKASLVGTFIWAKFQVEIQKYDLAWKMRSYRENWLKILYLVKNKLVARILLRFLSTLWVLTMSNRWAQTEGITWWDSLVRFKRDIFLATSCNSLLF